MYEADVGYHNKLLRIRQQQYDMVASGNPVGPRTYEVNINARPEQMLNWDAPLTQQPAAVQQIASDVLRNPGRGAGYVAGPITPDMPISGGNLYKALAAKLNTADRPGRDLLQTMSNWGSDPSRASAMLNEAGIPGIRYLDEGSRGILHVEPHEFLDGSKGFRVNGPRGDQVFDTFKEAQDFIAKHGPQADPTHNYVIFDPNKIDIRKMYAVPGAVGAGAAGMGALATQNNYQPQ
jgi:hypothetical protein